MWEGNTATSRKHGTHKAALLLTLFVLLAGLITAFNIQFENPTDGANVSGNYTFNVSVPSVANITNVTFYTNKSTAYPNFNQSFAFVKNASTNQHYFTTTNDTVALFNDGVLWVNATAQNRTTHNSTVIRINIDNTKPTITIQSPENTSITDTTPYVNTTASEPIKYWNYSMDAGGNTSYTPNQTTLSALGDGQHNITVWAEDLAGNLNKSTGYFRVDANAPTIMVFSPLNNTNVSGTIDVNATAHDAGTSVTVFQYRWRNATWNGTWRSLLTRNDSFNTADGTLQDAYYNISFRANDTLDNQQITRVSGILVDNTAPNATDAFNFTAANRSAFITASGTNVFNAARVGFDWSSRNMSTDFKDALSHYNNTQLMAQNRSYNLSSHSFPNSWGGSYVLNNSVNITANTSVETLGNGYEYRVWLRVFDTAGNPEDSNKIQVAIDTHAPQFAQNNTGQNATTPFMWTNTSNPDIHAKIADVVGIQNTSVFMNITNLSDSWGRMLNISTLGATNQTMYTVANSAALNLTQDNNYSVYVNASDLFSQYAELNWTFRTDFRAPNNVSLTRFNTSTALYDDNGTVWYRDNYTVQTQCADSLSGVKDVAVYRGNNAGTEVNAWNTSLNSNDQINNTVSTNGNHTYTFKCRDVAGNVNETQNLTIAIDANAPTKDSEGFTFDDGASKQPINFTFEANFSDSESGINDSASSVELITGAHQSGSINSVKWENGHLSLFVHRLNNDDSYIIRITTVDNVGHEKTWDVGFRTKKAKNSGSQVTATGGVGVGSSSSSAGALSFTTMPDTVSVVKGTPYTFDARLANSGSTNQTGVTFDIFVNGGMTATADPSDFTLQTSRVQPVTITLDTDNAVAGTHRAWLFAESDQGVITRETFNVTVSANSSNLSIAGPATINVKQGEQTSPTFNISNTGSVAANNVSFTLETAHGITANVTPEQATVPAGGTVNVTVNLSPVNGAGIGVYKNSLVATVNGEKITRNIDVKVQPAATPPATIRTHIKQLEDRFNHVKSGLDKDNASRIESMLQKANTALDSGDYATAAEMRKQLSAELGQPAQNGFPLVGLLLFVLVVGVIFGGGYVVAVHEDQIRNFLEVESERYRFEEPAAIERAVNSVKKLLLGVVGPVSDAVSRLRNANVPARNTGNGGKKQYRYRNKAASSRNWVGKMSGKVSDRVSRASEDVSQRVSKKELPFVSEGPDKDTGANR